MKLVKNIFHCLYFIYLVAWFVVLIIGSFFITLFLLLLPIEIRDRAMFVLMKVISQVWFVLIGIIQKTYNASRIDFSKSYIITPNHQSYIDAAIIYTSIPGIFKTLGKVEIEKAPIYGLIYKTVVITVDRSSMTARANSFRRMKRELQNGISIVLFSEGTFPAEPTLALQPFQPGGYSLAIMQQIDVLPMLFLDAANRMHPSKIWKATPGLNRCVFLPPLKSEGLNQSHTNIFKAYAQRYMQACMDFCKANSVNEVWDYALTWQKNYSIEIC